MSQAIFRHDGFSIDYTPTSDVPAGEVIVQGELVGVARLDIKAGTLGTLAVSGVFDFAKAGGSAINVGALVYWDDTNNVATTSSGGGANKLIGKCVRTAASADTRVLVRMS